MRPTPTPPTPCWARSSTRRPGLGWSRSPRGTGCASTSVSRASGRLPSLPSDPAASTGGLFGRLSGGSGADLELSDRAVLRAMLAAERALATAGARVGVVPEGAAAAIAVVCQAGRFDPAELGRRAVAAGNPVVPLVGDLTQAVAAEAGAAAAGWVHHGATSQDILDTAISLVAARALGPVLDDLDGAAEAAAGLAEQHRDTVMAGRTLGQHALPVSFGFKAAGWLVALEEAAAGLARVRRERLAAQLGGAAGTLAAFGPHGIEVARVYAAELELAEPAGGGRGGSSTLPHKHNPVGAVLVVAGTRRVPGLVASLLGSMAQEQERASGAWHGEWEPLVELLRLAGGAAARTRELLGGLEVHPDRMRANLEGTGGQLLTERVAGALTNGLGRGPAQELLRRLSP